MGKVDDRNRGSMQFNLHFLALNACFFIKLAKDEFDKETILWITARKNQIFYFLLYNTNIWAMNH